MNDPVANKHLRRFKPYPAYKESGVEWLGKIPAHWEVKRIRDFAKSLQTGPFGSQLHANEYVVGGYPVINPANIRDGTLIADEECTVNEATAERLAHHRLREGDILFARRGELGRCGLTTKEQDGWLCGTGCLRLRANPDMARSDFLVRLVSTGGVADWLGLQSVGATMQNVNTSIIGRIPVVLPAAPEQADIAAFLDRETARIDALISKKERLIELLKEQRTTLISRAVTKGLEPNVPMKDSGVQWLGEIPAHWALVPSTWLFTEGKQRALDGDQQLSATQKYGVIPQLEFERLEGRQVVHAFLHLDQRKHVEVDDFVMSMRSFEGGLERVRAPGCVRSSYIVLRRSAEVHVGFFSYLFKSSAYIQALRATSNFIRDGQDLNFENFRLVRLPLIPLKEQQVIAVFLDRETARIDSLVLKVGDAIERLKELRTALISAAVTGKIDVREEAA